MAQVQGENHSAYGAGASCLGSSAQAQARYFFGILYLYLLILYLLSGVLYFCLGSSLNGEARCYSIHVLFSKVNVSSLDSLQI